MSQKGIKGYWIARVDKGLNSIAFAKFGGRFVVRGPAGKVARGTARQHNVVVEFESYAQALACYDSPEYQNALQHLKEAGQTDLVIIEGYQGPQPG
jgi:uncharacterized protein (DUF1330 family)